MASNVTRFVLMLVVAGWSLPALAQATTDDTRPARGELAELAGSLQQVVELLRSQAEHREVELELRRTGLAIAALQTRSTVILDRESELRRLRERLDRAAEEHANIEAEIAQIEQVRAEEEEESMFRRRMALMIARLEEQRDRVSESIWSVEKQILDLENEILRRRRDIERLEALVDEALGDL